LNLLLPSASLRKKRAQNLLGQPSGKAERTIKFNSGCKSTNKKRNRQIFLTVSALFYAPTHDVAPRAVSIADAIDAMS